MTALVTGAAGLIGAHVCPRLVASGLRVIGLDAFTDFYDPRDKRATEASLCTVPAFTFLARQLEWHRQRPQCLARSRRADRALAATSLGS